ncbi:DUF2750 domain-containing protein [Neptuniibacter sp.]|uniref:DUF2750 domain-containing protein n=1 Tax=Neptuniibacter sp. TaxID=1962643 RepID=UPI0026028BF0|nr:DUF2750 domain-containing protein [Neptuniibacter sp.]MCP4597616.1 DUF2750 domain-containing protein [Neptuniibacter sp.]
MSDSSDLESILKMDNEQLYFHFVTEAVKQQQIWILTDHYGSVMLNTDDEDCVPVWPSQELAEAWATEEWGECKAEAISLKKWYSHWTPGLEEDGFAVVICPIEHQDGVVAYADDLDAALRKKEQKLAKKKNS